MPLLAIIIAIAIWHFRSARTVTSIQLYEGAKPTFFQRGQLPFLLLTLAACLAWGAIHYPTVTCSITAREHVAPTIAVVLDMSGSMEAADWPTNLPLPQNPTPESIPPTRIETAKQHIEKLLENSPNAYAVLVAFAENTVLVSPISQNKTFLLKRLDQLETSQFQDGTSIGIALSSAAKSLKHAPPGPKSIVLLSDGVDHATNTISPEDAAAEAQQAGITVHTVAIGGKQALHPVTTDSGIRWEPVGEPLDLEQLKRIANITGGQTFTAQDADQLATAVNTIAEDIQRQSTEYKTQQDIPLSPTFLALALCLAAIARKLQP